MTPGTDNVNLDGISDKVILDMSKKLKRNAFKYKAARRIDIPKPNKPKETRHLSIASPRDKIIQQAFKQVLEIIFEGVSYKKEVIYEEFIKIPPGQGEK